MIADLHAHSTYSDGTLTPGALVAHAQAAAVTHLALTDHDELRGLEEAAAAARRAGIVFIPGVEISSQFAGQSVHVVGLGIDPSESRLVARLDALRQWRRERAQRMAEGLAQAGIPGALEGALRYVHNPDVISRTHFARYLVEAGYCANKGEVFARFMKPGKPGYVPDCWLELDEAVSLIRGAGGVAVLAHPGRYAFDVTTMNACLDVFVAAGGQAIEVLSGAHTPADWSRFGAIARRRGLYGSVGSDFHGSEEGRVQLGTLPLLSPSIPHVLALLPSYG